MHQTYSRVLPGAYHSKFVELGGPRVFHDLLSEEMSTDTPDHHKRECCLLALKNLLLDGVLLLC